MPIKLALTDLAVAPVVVVGILVTGCGSGASPAGAASAGDAAARDSSGRSPSGADGGHGRDGGVRSGDAMSLKDSSLSAGDGGHPPDGDAASDSGGGAPDAPAGEAGRSIIFGMYNNTAIPPAAETASGANFRAIASTYFVGARTKVHRVFNDATSFPATYSASAGADDPANGNVSFLSVKPPNDDHAGVVAGTYDPKIKSLAASIPAGSYFTMWHEPENDMPAADFVAMFQHFYGVAKTANPEITIGYVAMSYQWRPGSSTTGPTTADEDAWYPGDASTDFLAVDTYDFGWSGQHSLDTQPDFQRWYSWALPKGKPILIAEYGVEPSADNDGGFSDSVRASILKQSVSYAAGQPAIQMILYWNGTAATPGGVNLFLNPTTSHPADDFALARGAWNAGVAQYGTSRTTY